MTPPRWAGCDHATNVGRASVKVRC